MRRVPRSAKVNGKATTSGQPADSILLLEDSARRGELVVVVGAGVSQNLVNNKVEALSWRGLIRNGLAYGQTKGRLTAAQSSAWKPQLESDDLDDILAAAEFMGRKLEAPNGALYGRWLEGVFSAIRPGNPKMEQAIKGLHAARVPLCTLNYDHLLEHVTGLPSLTLSETGKVTAWMRRESQAILHLHGSWDQPASCILGIRDYESTVGSEVRDLIQRSLAAFNRLLFVGCGDTLGDPNFAALIRWLRGQLVTSTPQHYALVLDSEVAARHADPAWHGFVEPLGYGATHADLAPFLRSCFSGSTVPAGARTRGPRHVKPMPPDHERQLRDYRAFLVRDCGQMTIEGVRADMDTAQRRFDLERLFVPLKVLPCPPEIPENDPNREQKLLKWQEVNNEPVPFGRVLARHRRLALLALPGGGKSLLLKRLAVAYAEPRRRGASPDGLPQFNLTPVLIRCREWREHIHRPITALLEDIPAITGQVSLTGLSTALLPLFEAGRALLLIDGLDEIHDDALRTEFVEHLESFLDEYTSTRLVVTSREAGFGLVAPCLNRFCQRWRVAPLQPDAITALCDNWHQLMKGDAPEARAESSALVRQLLGSTALLRLAENPLLLTMLLVVKHGAGRLPPDRVSLYGRAVEVLLDTWNIKGHEPLKPKEAVPQIAFLALQLLRQGKQTATEGELLRLLDEAREKMPQIRRYAKDTPYDFLKRVELRSSLLVEAGRQRDGVGTTPFYQFRHLTFQEYLAAVAVVDGHYLEYSSGDTVLTPLAAYLQTDEWKEVVPMAAVLARKQAEPLMVELVTQGNVLREALVGGQPFAGKTEWMQVRRVPRPIAHLMQCLVEEAEASQETLTSAMQLILLFARGCRSREGTLVTGPRVGGSWETLSRGLYGDELLHQAWRLYEPMDWPEESWLLNTCVSLAASRRAPERWESGKGAEELQRLLTSDSIEDTVRGLWICAGVVWNSHRNAELGITERHMPEIEKCLFSDEPVITAPAAWAWAFGRREKPLRAPSPLVLDRLLRLWLSGHPRVAERVVFALSYATGLTRESWRPVVSEDAARTLCGIMTRQEEREDALYRKRAALVVAFHAGTVCSEEVLAGWLGNAIREAGYQDTRGLGAMLKQLSPAARKYVKGDRTRQEKKK
jgi:hypothetical protein